jgi:hypothetical protein
MRRKTIAFDEEELIIVTDSDLRAEHRERVGLGRPTEIARGGRAGLGQQGRKLAQDERGAVGVIMIGRIMGAKECDG